jgi:two-component system sporulation sensor kinase A
LGGIKLTSQDTKINVSHQNPLSSENLILFENHSDAILVLNLQGEIIYVNQAVSNLLGYAKDELLNFKFQEILSPQGLEIFNYYFQIAAKSDTQEFITGINCKNGKELEIKIITVSNEKEGQIVSLTGFLTGVTEQSIVMAGINRTSSKELCESFIENNMDPILLLDLDAVIVLANRAFSQLLGWRKENLEGFHILHCPSIPPHLVEQMRDYYTHVVNAEQHVTTLETIRINQEGRAYYMMLSITPICDRNDEICNWAVHLRDITAQKEAEKALFRAEKLLTFGQFAASVAHEIRNPLKSLKGFIQSAKNLKGEVVYSHNQLDYMIDELNRIESFVNDLSILAKTQIQSYEVADVADLLKSAIAFVQPQAMLSDIHIDFDDAEVPVVWGDGQQLKQAFFHVIQNAVESMPMGGDLHVNLEPLGEYLRINVIDHGAGIPEDFMEKLGEPIYSTKEKRLGLGLALTYKIIEQHHGKITVQSQAEKGTQFTIELPIMTQNKNQTA